MKPVTGYTLIEPDDLQWRPSNLMCIPNADFLERTGSENLGARLWRRPPHSANTLHKHIRQEEFYFVLEGVGRMRIGGETVTVPRHGGYSWGRSSCGRFLTTPTSRCSGSSSARRRNWNSCKARSRRRISPFITPKTRRNSRRNSPGSSGRRKGRALA